MKSRQRLEQTNQMSLGDLPQAVCKPQDSISNSTAPLQETLKLEIVGQTRTNKHCNHCSVELTEDVWAVGNVRKGNYICKTCDSIKGRKNRLKRKARLLGEYMYRQYSGVKEGAVYIITNKAWEGWIKVGMAIDAEDRLKSYQTSSPFRDYTLLYVYEVNDRRAGESAAHARLAKECDNINEWFRIPHAVANELILEVIHEY